MTRWADMTPEQKAAHSARSLAWRKANKEAARAIQRRSDQKNPQRVRAQCKRWREANKTYDRARTKAWMANNKDKMRDSWRRKGWRTAGIDPIAAKAAISAHNGLCDCCGSNKHRGKGWSVDHDHQTGRIRGVLCSPCNLAIGQLGDTLEGVLRAVKYLSTGPMKGQANG